MSLGYFKATRDGVLVDVRLTPRSTRDGLDGIGALADGRRVVLARVRALPENGAANAALEKLMAKELALPRSSVAVVAGHTSRLKTVQLAGDADELAVCLRAIDPPR